MKSFMMESFLPHVGGIKVIYFYQIYWLPNRYLKSETKNILKYLNSTIYCFWPASLDGYQSKFYNMAVLIIP